MTRFHVCLIGIAAILSACAAPTPTPPPEPTAVVRGTVQQIES